MSFCRKCGAELHDSADFCANCGEKVDKSLTMTANQTIVPNRAYPDNALNMGTIRKMQIAEADNVYYYFMTKKDQYEQLIDCQKTMESIKAPNRYNYWIASVCLLDVSLLLFDAKRIALGIISLIVTVIFFALMRKRYKHKVEKCDKLIETTQSRIDALTDELGAYYEAYPDCPIGPEYTFPSVLNELIEIVHSGRADSLKEAINIMITDGRLSNMESSAAEAAAGAKAAAVFSALDFFLK